MNCPIERRSPHNALWRLAEAKALIGENKDK